MATLAPVHVSVTASATGAAICADPDATLPDAGARDDTTYLVIVRVTGSGTAYIGADGHGSDDAGDYADLGFSLSNTDGPRNWPTMIRRRDLPLFRAYASSNLAVSFGFAKAVS